MHHLNQSCNRSVEKFIAPISCLFPIVDWFTVANVVALVGWWEGKSQCRSDCTFLIVLIDYIVNENAIQIHFHYIAIGTFSDSGIGPLSRSTANQSTANIGQVYWVWYSRVLIYDSWQVFPNSSASWSVAVLFCDSSADTAIRPPKIDETSGYMVCCIMFIQGYWWRLMWLAMTTYTV